MADPSELMAIQFMSQLPDNRRGEFQFGFHSQKKERTTALLLSIFLGHFGADRFYLGHTGLGVGKLLTFGGCGLWTIIDWFLIMSAADKHNLDVLQKLSMMYAPGMATGYGPPQISGYGPPPQGPYGPPPPPGGYGR